MEELLKVCPAGPVLDPFAGSATTGVAALRSGREFVGCELVEAYHRLGCERLEREADGKADHAGDPGGPD